MRFLRSNILLVLLLLLGVSSELRAVSWKTFTDSREVNSVILYEGDIWAGTGGGVLRFGTDGSNLVKYTNSEGLGANDVTAAIAAGGYAWFGSQTGRLSRFDASDGSWKVFVLSDRDGNAVSILDMAVSGEYLWLATGIGVSKFDMFRNGGEVKETYRRLGGFTPEMPILSVFIDGDIVVAASEEGIARASVYDELLQDYTHWTTFTRANSIGFPSADIMSVARWRSVYWIGTSGGLYDLIETDTVDSWHFAGFNETSIGQLTVLDDTLWAVGSDRVVRSASESVFETYPIDGLPDVELMSICILSSERIVIGSKEDGVFQQTGVDIWRQALVPGPSSNSIVGLGHDSKRTLWAAARAQDVSSFDGTEWKHFELPRAEGGQRALVVDHLDNVWVGTWQLGVFRIAGDSIVRYDTTNSSLYGNSDADGGNYIVNLGLSVDDNGRVWFSCYRGHPMRPVSFCDPSADTWDYYTNREGFSDHFIQSIHVVGSTLYTGFENAGVFKTELGDNPFDHSGITSRQYTTNDYLLPSDNIRVITSIAKVNPSDPADTVVTVWFGTNAGLAYYDEDYDRFFRVTLPTGAGPQVNALEGDLFGNLWIGTSNSLVRLDANGQDFDVFTTSNSGIAGDEVTSLDYAGDGYLWVGTSSGLSRLDFDTRIFTQDVEQVMAFPNPAVVPDNGQVLFNFLGTAEVSIFTVAGELVREVIVDDDEGWDFRNEAGEFVASGLYLFHIKTADGHSHTGKIAVIRR